MNAGSNTIIYFIISASHAHGVSSPSPWGATDTSCPFVQLGSFVLMWSLRDGLEMTIDNGIFII